ncbi:MAG: DNA replication/repair protein RecF [Brevundimonas sp.]|uniref:DNA replication/repair protein RecF n=1 Tax=Brevundimonas sp. TaxID=1871086 RepID=UPI00391C6CB3
MITSLTLTDFRSYERAGLDPGAGPVVLYGANGAGKTNLLEAVSLLSPGRGLRAAAFAELGRRHAGEAEGRSWAVSALVETGDGLLRLGTGASGPSRRIVRIDGQSATPGQLLEHLRPVWATPEHDRLFSDARAARLRFLDRLVFASSPEHAAHVSAYEKALRERIRVLGADEMPDPLWLDAIEAQMAVSGARAALLRRAALAALQGEIDARSDRPFPQADLRLDGAFETESAGLQDAGEIAGRLAAGLKASRGRDRASGRSLFGPHRADLRAVHRAKRRDAAEGSTGEQKALMLNLILAQAARLSRGVPGAENPSNWLAKSGAKPVVLLDEAPAHLDGHRRAALFEEIVALGLQAFLTGTDDTLFSSLKGRAAFVRVEPGALIAP